MSGSRKFEIPTIPPEFLIKLPQAKGKDFITANGLIYLGHLQGLKRVDVQVIHVPTKDDPSAIVRCEVETDLGVFSDYGEVSPANKGTVGGQYPLSMATTRSRNRALRIATGCPLTSYEEMGMEPEAANVPTAQTPTDADEAPSQEKAAPPTTPKAAQPRPSTPPVAAPTPPPQPATEAQRQRIVLLRRLLGQPGSSVQALTAEQATALLVDLEARSASQQASEEQYTALTDEVARVKAAYGRTMELPDGEITVAQYAALRRRLVEIETQLKAGQPVAAGAPA